MTGEEYKEGLLEAMDVSRVELTDMTRICQLALDAIEALERLESRVATIRDEIDQARQWDECTFKRGRVDLADAWLETLDKAYSALDSAVGGEK